MASKTDQSQNYQKWKPLTGVPKFITSARFLDGEFGQEVYDLYQQEREHTYNGNFYLRLKLENGVVKGSNFFDTVLINQILKRENIQGDPRTLLPIDLSNPEILNMIEGKYYTDSQALILREVTNSDSRNEPLAIFLTEQERLDPGRLEKEPAMLYGFNLQPWPEDEKGYGLKVAPNEEFMVHHDDRLLSRWNGYKFNEIDEIGLPLHLDRIKGSRVWYIGKEKLSKLNIGSSLNLCSNWDSLDDSFPEGRIVIVSDKATKSESQ